LISILLLFISAVNMSATEKGVASWYGAENKVSASGKRLNHKVPALAHKTLPLGGGTLAAGGGGVAAGTCVLGGIVAAPALLCASFVMHSQAERVETQTERYIAKIDENEAQQWRLCEETNVFVCRANELEESTLRLETELKSVLAAADPDSEEEAYRVAKIAAALGQLLEQSVLPKSQASA